MKEKKMGSLPSFWGMHASRYVPLPLRSKKTPFPRTWSCTLGSLDSSRASENSANLVLPPEIERRRQLVVGAGLK